MINRPAVALVLSSALLASCGAGDGRPELSTETPAEARTTEATAVFAVEASAPDPTAADGPETADSGGGRTASTGASTSTGTAAEADSADQSSATDPAAETYDPEGAMSQEEMDDLERTLDEIDDLLADLEIELEAD